MILDKLKQLSIEAKAFLKAGLPLVTDSDQADRIGKCGSCEHFDRELIGRCKLCGCLMFAKSWLATSKCPDVPPRWLATHRVWFFDSGERQQELFTELAKWRGTPFWKKTAGHAVLGVKADCVSFVAAVMQNLGALNGFQWPSYVTHGGGANMRLVLERTLGHIPNLVRIWGEGGNPGSLIQPGDLLAGSSGEAMHHLAIAGVPGRVWHCLESGGVQEGTVADPILQKHLIGVYRFKA